jgi:hypothetical protein
MPRMAVPLPVSGEVVWVEQPDFVDPLEIEAKENRALATLPPYSSTLKHSTSRRRVWMTCARWRCLTGLWFRRLKYMS